MLSVLDFDSCQAWLKAYVRAQKEQGITLAQLSKRLGVASSTLHMMSQGKRQFTLGKVQEFAKRLDLSKVESDHLVDLFLGKERPKAQSKTAKGIRELRTLERDLMSRWFVPALLVYILDQSAAGAVLDFKYLASRTGWKVSQIESLFQKMKERGILEVRKGGQIHLVSDKMAANFSKQAFMQELLTVVDSKIQKEFSNPDFYVDAHTITLSKALYKEFRDNQKEMIKDLLEKAEGLDPRQTEVFQIFVSSFPVL